VTSEMPDYFAGIKKASLFFASVIAKMPA
jgi:hypothetical protein